MFHRVLVLLAMLAFCLVIAAAEREVKLKIVQTSDIHGSYYPVDLRSGMETAGSLACVHAFLQQQREQYGDNLILLENGDILQGQPSAYYYNYIDTVCSPNNDASCCYDDSCSRQDEIGQPYCWWSSFNDFACQLCTVKTGGFACYCVYGKRHSMVLRNIL